MINCQKNNKQKTKDNEKYYSGLKGEELAIKYFSKNGFKLVSKRYKSSEGEIDLIMENNKQKIIVFIEVKRRKEVYDYSCVISKKQWKRIYKSSEVFLIENFEKYKNFNIRYDAFICFTNSDNFFHIENIFQNEIS